MPAAQTTDASVWCPHWLASASKNISIILVHDRHASTACSMFMSDVMQCSLSSPLVPLENRRIYAHEVELNPKCKTLIHLDSLD